MKNEPKVVVAAGDWHGNQKYALAAIAYAQRNLGADTIVHVGDFGYNFGNEYLDRMQKLLKELDMYLYFVDGNHENFHILYTYALDDDGTRPLRDRIIHLPRGHRWKWNDETWLALGGAVSVDKDWRVPFKEWWPEETISFGDVLVAVQGGEVDYMITHDCPSGVLITSIIDNPYGFPAHSLRDAEAHRDTLRSVVDEVKPKLLVHGHYHQYYKDKLVGDDYVTQVYGLHCDGESMTRNMRVIMEVKDAPTDQT